MATYNGEKYLEQQLDSIVKQTFKDFEVFICDDQSTDDTHKILKKYSEEFNNINFEINSKKLGVTRNFEKAISKANSKWILLCDQDDIWYPNKIERLVNEIGNYSLIYSNGNFIDEKNLKIRTTLKEHYILYGLDSSNKDLFKYLSFNSFILGCSMFFDRSILINKIPETTKNHDWIISLYASENNGVKFLDEELFSYRIHSSNYSMSQKKISKLSKFVNFFNKERINKRNKLENETKSIFLHMKDFILINKENIKYIDTFLTINSKNIISQFSYLYKNRVYIYPYEKGLTRILHIISKIKRK